jgi:hypothetical protein
MVAPKGNNFAIKLKTPELKEEAYKQYCEWISQGRSKEGWKFKHPEMSLTSKTMEKYIQENPQDFPPIHKEIALADSYAVWEEIGKRLMMGEVKGAQPAIYQMFMRNKFGWDKEIHTTSSVEPEARSLWNAWSKKKDG